MNLSEIRDLIKAEAGLKGFEANEILIDSMINQELLAFTGKSKYAELLTEITFTPLQNGEYAFDIPADFQLFNDLTYFRDTALYPDFRLPLVRGSGRFALGNGTPRFYSRVGTQFHIYPFTELYTSDSFVLEYYKKVTLLNDADPFPVESLEKPVIQMVMARLLAPRDSRASMIAKSEGKLAWQDSRAQNAGN